MLKFDRLQILINLIQSRPGIKAPELARETGVCERTVYRDLVWLASQYPVIHNHGYSLPASSKLKPLTITKAEYSIFQLALSSPALLRSDLKPVACSLKAKIDSVVDPSVRCRLNRVNIYAPILAGGCSDTQRIATFCGILQQAIARCRAVDLDSVNDIQECSRIYPYHLVYCYPDWVLVGFNRSKRDFEALKLSLLKEISLTNNTFERDATFSIEEFFASRWHLKGGKETKVQVRFTGTAARLVHTQRQHPREEVKSVCDGTVLYTVTVAGTEEITKWILSFGAEAEVLAPNSLRKQMREQSKDLAAVYRKKSNLIKKKRELDSTSRLGC